MPVSGIYDDGSAYGSDPNAQASDTSADPMYDDGAAYGPASERLLPATPNRRAAPAVIVFSNRRGGMQATTTVLHVATAMAMQGYRVLAIDATDMVNGLLPRAAAAVTQQHDQATRPATDSVASGTPVTVLPATPASGRLVVAGPQRELEALAGRCTEIAADIEAAALPDWNTPKRILERSERRLPSPRELKEIADRLRLAVADSLACRYPAPEAVRLAALADQIERRTA